MCIRDSVYTTEDPQLLISGIVEGTSRLYVELSVQTISPDAAYACMNLLNRVRRAEDVYKRHLMKTAYGQYLTDVANGL